MNDRADESRVDLAQSKALAIEAARHWGLELEPPFSMSTVSYVAPAGAAVVKVAWDGDDESLHEPDALRLWNGDGAVRIRAWTIIRGAYLRPTYAARIGSLLSS